VEWYLRQYLRQTMTAKMAWWAQASKAAVYSLFTVLQADPIGF